MANTAYALFDKTAEKITFKYNTELTSNLNVSGVSTLSNLTVPVTATLATANITTANVTTDNITTANITTGNVTTLNSTNATLSNINNQSLTGNVATLSNLTVLQTTNTSNLIGTTATLSNIYSSNVNVVNAMNSQTVQTTSTIRSGDYVRGTNEMRIAGTTATLRIGNQSGPANQESQYNAVKAIVTSGAFATLNINADNQFNQIITTVPTGGLVDNQCLTQTNTLNVVSDASIGGKLGIGVTGTPTEKLDIVGNAKITGNATVTGNIDLGTFTSSIMKPVRYKYTTSVYSSSSPSSFTNVAQLNFALDADTFYTFKALLVVNTNGAGFKLQVGLTAAQNGTIGNWTVTSLPAPSASQFVFDGNTNNIAVWTSLPLNDRNIITIEGRVWTNAADTLKINFAPNSTGVADVTYFSTIEWNGVPSWL